MHRLHIVGRKNHGKTQLICELIPELTRRGLRVATIKHTHHRHELDTPGKDSQRHRLAGAAAVGLIASGMTAVFLPTPAEEPPSDPWTRIVPLFVDCDLVLVEGDLRAAAPKLEVWRAEMRTEPLAQSLDSVLAIVSNDRPNVPCPVLPRNDVPAICDWIGTWRDTHEIATKAR